MIIIGVFALLILLIGGYFVIQSANKEDVPDITKIITPTPTLTPTVSPTTINLKTYVNTHLDFTFKYPASYTYEQSTYTSEEWNKYRSFSVTFKPVDFAVETNATASLSILTHAFEGYTKLATDKVTVDGVEAIKETWQTDATGVELYKEPMKIIDIKFTKNSDVYVVFFNYKVADEKIELANFNNILTSFKFIVPTPTPTP
ncbi:MAG: hypothetical protein NTW60_00245 [Candidatus Wolfebacteria bacterium]|nr:hypothetical protein [Candidatus Wolfebacteria bacterium]